MSIVREELRLKSNLTTALRLNIVHIFILSMGALTSVAVDHLTLGHYRQLPPPAADRWAKFGHDGPLSNRRPSFKLLDAYYDADGNFNDMANYIMVPGKLDRKKAVRDQMIVATKQL
ncbi:hypothetical protein A0H81_14908 [Grifola frondosa]|uniref:Uncharacterized protein n=1 Tax=Grifola frondosa TaxID=5627 RepID=A0A1C7LJY4_GRIFR|nr:hypothetical protein A0H81_14908 [Grifola frondosa]